MRKLVLLCAITMGLSVGVGCQSWDGTYHYDSGVLWPNYWTVVVHGEPPSATFDYTVLISAEGFACQPKIEGCAGSIDANARTFSATGCTFTYETGGVYYPCLGDPTPVDLSGAASNWDPNHITELTLSTNPFDAIGDAPRLPYCATPQNC